MLRNRSLVWVILALGVAAGSARGADALASPDAPDARAGAASGPRLTAVAAPPKAIRPGATLRVKVTAVGATSRPVSARVSARMTPTSGRPLTIGARGTVKVRRGKATRATVSVSIPHGGLAGRYRLSICLRAGKGAARCRTAGTFTLLAECSCAQPGPRPSAPTSAAAGSAAGATPPAGDGQAPAPGDGLTLDPNATPNPVSVDPTLDTAHARTASIDTMGGTVEATGADGVHYRLDIPYGALLARTDITVTPLKSVGGLPFSGGLVAGAALAPDGLRFSAPVTLTITNAPAVAPERETPFGYRGDGRDLGLVPLVRDPHVQAFQLLHFSAYGIASGTEAERRAQLVRTTTDVEGQLQQILAFEVQMDRWYGLTRQGRPWDYEILEDAMEHYHELVIAPLLQAAMTDVELAPRALTKYLAWERQLQWLFEKDFLKAERAARYQDFLKVLHHVAEHYYNKCLAGDPGALPILLAWSRQAQLMGLTDEIARENQVFQACMRFEVDLETTIDQGKQGQDQTFHGHLKTDTIALTLQGGFQVYGTGAWHEDSFTILPKGAPDVGCWLDTSGFKATDTAFMGPLSLQVNWIEDADGQEYHLQEADIADVGLAVAPLQTYEDVHWGFCGGSTGQGGDRNWLGVTLDGLHADERAPGQFGWVIKNWTRPSNSAFVLTRHWARTKLIDNSYPTTEDTTITLRHAPAPLG